MAQLTSNVYVKRTFSPNTAIAAVAAGSSAVDGLAGASIEMTRWDGVLFLGGVVGGGTGGNVSFSVRASSAEITAGSSGGQGTALSGTTSTIAAGSSASAESFAVDVYKPRQYSTPGGGGRHLFSQYTVASSCCVLAQMWAIVYTAHNAATSTALSAITVPQSTAASTGTGNSSGSGLTGGLVRAVSPST